MNAKERKDLDRAQRSQQKWRQKALKRGKDNRALRGKVGDVSKSRDQWRERSTRLKDEVEELKKTSSNGVVPTDLSSGCSVSFRSIPKILKAFLSNGWVPHFTSVILWLLRVGLYLLQQVTISQVPCLWIIDHTIQVGKKKAMLILRAPVDLMTNQRGAIPSDFTAISIVVRETWTGIQISQELQKVAQALGSPLQIISDAGSDIKKGIEDFVEKSSTAIHLTYDISHFLAALLKKKYEKLPAFIELMQLINESKNKLRQTAFAFLTPPSVRSKARFLNLSDTVHWLERIQKLLTIQGTVEAQAARIYYSWLTEYSVLIQNLILEISTINEIQKILKTHGLNDITYQQARLILKQLPEDSKLRACIKKYLDSEYQFCQQQSCTAMTTSDPIETVFGIYKDRSKPDPVREINRSILMLPCLCTDITPELTQKAFQAVSVEDVKRWVKENCPDTLLAKKQRLSKSLKFFKSETSEKIGQKAA